jgi:hypothetical protein
VRAVAQAVQTRCGECGLFVRRRLDVLDGAYDDLAGAYNEAAYSHEWEDHDCQATTSMAPRAGEHDAYLASIGDGVPVELEGTDERAAAALAPSLGQAIRNISIHSEETTSGQHEAPAVRTRLHAGLPGSRRGAARRAHVRPAPPVVGGEQLGLGWSAGPGRQRHPVRPAPYPTASGGRARPAARTRRDGAAVLPLAGVGWDRDRDPVVPLRGGLTAPPAPEPRRRGGLRLSRLLRWFQQDDPRLARPLERPARALEWLERMYDT